MMMSKLRTPPEPIRYGSDSNKKAVAPGPFASGEETIEVT